MDAKAYLKEIEDLETNIQIEKEELVVLWGRATSCTAPTDKEPGRSSGVSDPVGIYGTELAEIRKEKERRIRFLFSERNRRVDDIKMVPHPKAKMVLYEHYVKGVQFCDIAADWGCAPQTISDYHNIGAEFVRKTVENRSNLIEN